MINFLFKYKTVANEKAYFKTGKYAEPYVSQIDEIAGGGNNAPYGVHFNRLLIISPETNAPLINILRSNTTSRGWLDTTATTNVYLDNVSGVTSFPSIFAGNTAITSFDEFQWWYSVKTSPSFKNCRNLVSLKTPAGLTAVPSQWLGNDTSGGARVGALRRLNSDTDGEIILLVGVKEYWINKSDWSNGYEFNKQGNITKVVVPSGVKSIGREMFAHDCNIKEIHSYIMTTPQVNPTAWSYMFDSGSAGGGWTKATKIYYPKGGWAWVKRNYSQPIACDLDEYGRLIIPEN